MREDEVGARLLSSLIAKYEAELAGAEATLEIFRLRPVSAVDHSQHLEEMDKLIHSISETRGKTSVAKSFLRPAAADATAEADADAVAEAATRS